MSVRASLRTLLSKIRTDALGPHRVEPLSRLPFLKLIALYLLIQITILIPCLWILERALKNSSANMIFLGLALYGGTQLVLGMLCPNHFSIQRRLTDIYPGFEAPKFAILELWLTVPLVAIPLLGFLLFAPRDLAPRPPRLLKKPVWITAALFTLGIIIGPGLATYGALAETQIFPLPRLPRLSPGALFLLNPTSSYSFSLAEQVGRVADARYSGALEIPHPSHPTPPVRVLPPNHMWTPSFIWELSVVVQNAVERKRIQDHSLAAHRSPASRTPSGVALDLIQDLFGASEDYRPEAIPALRMNPLTMLNPVGSIETATLTLVLTPLNLKFAYQFSEKILQVLDATEKQIEKEPKEEQPALHERLLTLRARFLASDLGRLHESLTHSLFRRSYSGEPEPLRQTASSPRTSNPEKKR